MNNITAKDLLALLLKNLIIIILAAIICGVGAFVYCEKFTDERFASKGSILVTNGGLIPDDLGKPVENSQIAASVNLLPTVRDLLKSPGIYELVAKQFGNKYSIGQLMGAMRLSSSEEHSLVLNITFELASKDDVAAITNAFLNATPDYIASLVDGSKIYITAPATSSYKTAPQTAKNTSIAVIAGAAICYAVVFLISIFNTTIKSDDDFMSHYDTAVLGNIPDFDARTNKKSYYKSSQKGASENGK